MDQNQFVIELLDKIAWPGTVLILAYVFKDQVIRILHRLAEITEITKGDFKAQLAELKGVDPNQLKAQFGFPSGPPPPHLNVDLLQVASQFPRAGILEAWRRVERKMEEVLRSKNLSVPDSTLGLIRVLAEKEIIPYAAAGMIRRLYWLRNRVESEGHKLRLETEDSVDYANLVRDLLSLLDRTIEV